MKIGCFALVQPFLPVAEQLKLIKEMGVDYADVTDNHDGGSLGAEYDFSEYLFHAPDYQGHLPPGGMRRRSVM